VYELSSRRLYLCVGVRDDLEDFLPGVIAAGVDVVQLREKVLPDETRLAIARRMVAICSDLGVPFVMNDSPTLALDCGADGVHVGQDDVSVAACREILGAEAIVGLSTHATDEFDRALTESATYFSAGPIVPTPTKLGRPGTGVEYALACQARSERPVYVTGGVSASTVGPLVRAGLRHFVVVRAITEASDPALATREIRRALDEAMDEALENS
jgi:thiamine-phosphate pyrophosphorylase